MELRVWSYRNPLPGRNKFDDIPASTKLSLPSVAHRVRILRVEAAGPNYSSHGAPSELEVPFECDPQARLLAFTILVYPNPQDGIFESFHLFVPAEAIERYCNDADHCCITWDELAPNVRLISKHPVGVIGSGQLFHTKCICPDSADELSEDEDEDEEEDEDEDEDDEEVEASRDTPLVIFDFPSKFLLRRDMHTARFDNCEYVFEPTVIEDNRIWQGSITTGASCPYRRIKTSLRLCLRTGMFTITVDCIITGDEDGYVPSFSATLIRPA